MTCASSPGSIAIVIAAGGRGERMGGNKPYTLLGGKTLLDRARRRATSWGGPVALSMRGEQPTGSADIAWLTDSPALAGPVAALDSAFGFASARGCDFVLLIGCDMPFLPDDLPDRLLDAIGNAGAALPVSENGLQPMAGLWRVDEPALAEYVARGHRSLWRFARAQEAAEVRWPAHPDGDPFADIDDPPALARAEQRLAAGEPTV